jgi:hypothetical protein
MSNDLHDALNFEDVLCYLLLQMEHKRYVLITKNIVVLSVELEKWTPKLYLSRYNLFPSQIVKGLVSFVTLWALIGQRIENQVSLQITTWTWTRQKRSSLLYETIISF